MIFKRSKLNKIIQDLKFINRNKAAVKCLRELSYPDAKIRGALFVLNEITIPMMLKEHPELKSPTLYGTMQGRRPNKKAKLITSKAVGLEVSDFYPEHTARQ